MTGVPRAIDHDYVLNLWASGTKTSREIAERAGLKLHGASVRTIVQRARAKGDPRAASRSSGRLCVAPLRRRLLVPPDMWAAAALEAERRGISVSQFCLRVLGLVLTDKLSNAILDDEPARVSPPPSMPATEHGALQCSRNRVQEMTK